jgi:hypothetical protein
MPQQTQLYIVTSCHPRVGKTLLARLLTEFLRISGRPLVGYDLAPREPAFAGYFPNLVWPLDISDTQGQMALFDRILADHWRTTVIDLGHGLFDQFFQVMAETGLKVKRGKYRFSRSSCSSPTPRRSPREPMPSCASAWRRPFSCPCTMKLPRSWSSRRIFHRPRRNMTPSAFRACRRSCAGSSIDPASRSAHIRRPVDRAGARRSNEFGLMAFEAHQRAHRHAELSDLFSAAELRQIDDEAGGQHVGADLL